MSSSCSYLCTIIDVLADTYDGAVIRPVFVDGGIIGVRGGVSIDALTDVLVKVFAGVMVGAGVDWLVAVEVKISLALLTASEFIIIPSLECALPFRRTAFSRLAMLVLECTLALQAQIPSCHV